MVLATAFIMLATWRFHINFRVLMYEILHYPNSGSVAILTFQRIRDFPSPNGQNFLLI